MKLTQLKEGESLTLEVNIDGQNYDFTSQVVAVQDEVLLAEPVRIDGKVLNLDSDKVNTNLYFKKQNMVPIVWHSVKVNTVVYNKMTVYSIVSLGIGIEANRRTAFRVPVNVKGKVRMDVNGEKEDITVRDVSESGFSFYYSKDLEEFKRKVVTIEFSDESTDFSLSGLIVRKEVRDSNNIIYGCRLNHYVSALSKYISEKQRKMIVQQNEVEAMEGRVPLGYGDIRKVSDKDKQQVINELANEFDMGRPVEKKRPTKKMNKNLQTTEKKVNFERYKDLKPGDFN